jgi:hypothetical protein
LPLHKLYLPSQTGSGQSIIFEPQAGAHSMGQATGGATDVDVAGNGQLFNMTVKLGSLFSFPSRVSRVLASIRAFDGMLEQDMENAFGGAANFDGSNTYIGRTVTSPGLVPLPGPWKFVTSGYALALLAMVSVQDLPIALSSIVTTRSQGCPC